MTLQEKKEHYDEIKRENALFEDYYRRQEIVPQEEWNDILGVLATPLPTTFRITGHRREEAMATLQQLLKLGMPLREAGRLHPLEWYQKPRADLAWHLDVDRKTLRTDDGALGEFHRWLVRATENGDVSRQEAVSMIPPLFLDVKSHHRVLDLCAAPGSKTAQLVEAMHFDVWEQVADDEGNNKMVTGMVIANDADQQRAYMLHHQVRRILSPVLLVSNNDGTQFPHLVQRPNPVASSSFETFYFDRILADVPCSGDGTLRKNALLWRHWTPNLGLGLHSLQVRLLERAVRLLATGGRLVYSTCSLNPIENEAVVAAILHRHAGCLRLIDVSDQLPQLKRRPGKSTWRVISREGVEYSSESEVPSESSRRFPSTVFAKPEYEAFGLERCLRIYPHLQNTGGFFVAVMEKVCHSELTGETSLDTNNKVVEESPTEQKRKVPRPSRFIKVHEDEFRRLDVATDSTLSSIFAWYGIDRERILAEGWGFYVRSDRQPVKCITMVSPSTHCLFSATVTEAHALKQEGHDDASKPTSLFNRNLKIVNAGVRAFEIYETSRPLQNVESPYRLLYEAIDTLRPLITSRIAYVDATTMSRLLSTLDSIRIASVEELLKQGGALLECPLKVDQDIGNDGLASSHLTISVPVWISERGVKAFVAQVNRPALLSQLSPFIISQ